MEISLGAEVALNLHTEDSVSYTELEKALVDAGFENFTIMRNLNPDGSGDSQLYVRGEFDEQGQMTQLPAGATLTKLTEAMTALEELTPEEPPA